ncbi:MAG TPA: tetratricopeptide repeat protein [Methylococcaceae bacterium]|nr:tetratricopeptide repeat protein [Methylococcaceae bacterium]
MAVLSRYIGFGALLLAVLPVHADLEAGVEAVARRDFVAALKEFKPLAERGDVAAQVNLGNLYMKGLGVRQNYDEAARWYRNAAEQNEPMAQSKLGILYYYGLGVAQDYAEAGRWFLKAAGHGDAGAQTALGSLYALGEGLPRDYVQAYYWYSLAAEQGNPDALTGRSSIVDEMTPGQLDEALRLLSAVRQQTAKAEERALDLIGSGPTPRAGKPPTNVETLRSVPAVNKKTSRPKKRDQKPNAKHPDDRKKKQS